jgi:phytoene dehydrogenase-like protein
MLDFVFRMMALGDVALPAAGMGVISEQLAAGLPEGWIRTGSPVKSIEEGAVTLECGEILSSRSVVVATDWVTARRLLPELSHRESHGVTCIYLASDKPPLEEPVLVLNGEGGPINNLAVISNVAPSYSPSEASLISVTVLGVSPSENEDQQLQSVRDQLASWYGPQAHGWRHLRTYRIPHALPAQPAPTLSVPDRPVRIRPGLYICGDHRDNASLNGAMVSGKRAALALLKDLETQAWAMRS